jgi:hypothetical protein
VLLPENRQIVVDQFLVQRGLRCARSANQGLNIQPVLLRPFRIIAGRLDFKANDVFDPGDGQCRAGPDFQPLGPFKHGQRRAPECVENIDTPQLCIGGAIMRAIVRAKDELVSPGEHGFIRPVQILAQQRNIQINRRALHAPHGHGETPNQGVPDFLPVQTGEYLVNNLLEVHAGSPTSLRGPMVIRTGCSSQKRPLPSFPAGTTRNNIFSTGT